MTTHARIGVVLPEGHVCCIYCHFDGYPSFTGVKLIENHNSYEKAVDLVRGGDVESVWSDTTGGPSYWGDSPYQLLSYKDFLAYSEQYNYLFYKGKWCLVCPSSQNEIKGVAIELLPQ